MRQYIHLIRRWWREFWGTDDAYVRGVRLGTRMALNLPDHQIAKFINDFHDSRTTEVQPFAQGWIQGCHNVLKVRGYTDFELEVDLPAGRITSRFGKGT